MTYIGPDVCWFFDLGGDRELSSKNLFELKHLCHLKKTEVFFSHFDKDHIQFFRTMDQALRFSAIYLSHLDAQTKTGKSLLSYFSYKSAKINLLHQGDKIVSKEARLSCLWPPEGPQKNENSRSLTFVFDSGKKILLTGDLPGNVENKIWNEARKNPAIDILKVAHHGSHTSTYLPLLSKIKAKACIISVGKNNKYKHPRIELLDRLKKNRCASLRTDKLGTIILEL